MERRGFKAVCSADEARKYFADKGLIYYERLLRVPDGDILENTRKII